MRLPILIIHICAGVVGLLSGGAAISFRKGSHRHRRAGNIFFVAMLVMGLSAVYLGNVFGGLFACYLVTTAWLTAGQREGETNIFDWIALLFGVVVGVAILTSGVRVATGSLKGQPGVPVGMIFFVGSVVLLAAAGDVRMLVRGGVFGGQRIVRHMWRMCFGLFIATGSFFIGQPQVFPAFIRKTNLLFVLGILPLILMIFWFFRVRFTKAYKAKSIARTGDAYSIGT